MSVPFGIDELLDACPSIVGLGVFVPFGNVGLLDACPSAVVPSSRKFGIDGLLDACPSTFVTFGQLHPTCPSGTILSPHVPHVTPLASDWSRLVLGLLFLELPDD